MKNLTVLTLAILAVILMLYVGVKAMVNNHTYGPFMTFVGVCTAVGLGIDLINHIQLRIKKSNVRKLGRF